MVQVAWPLRAAAAAASSSCSRSRRANRQNIAFCGKAYQLLFKRLCRPASRSVTWAMSLHPLFVMILSKSRISPRAVSCLFSATVSRQPFLPRYVTRGILDNRHITSRSFSAPHLARAWAMTRAPSTEITAPSLSFPKQSTTPLSAG